MKILFIHADHITYRTTRKSKSEVIEDEVKEPIRVDDCLVLQICVQKSDEENREDVVGKTVSHTIKIAEQVKTKKIVLFPFAHLASDLATPQASIRILEKITEVLRTKGYEVFRVPFGWYKEWEIKNKGHPMSVLSRSF
jgi:threonyl-tRNA synthetase